MNKAYYNIGDLVEYESQDGKLPETLVGRIIFIDKKDMDGKPYLLLLNGPENICQPVKYYKDEGFHMSRDQYRKYLRQFENNPLLTYWARESELWTDTKEHSLDILLYNLHNEIQT